MSTLADLPELIGFFSYSRDDDDDSRGTLSELRDRIQRELRGQLGRSRNTLRIWQDKEAIAPGKLWESEIKAALDGAVFFIPILTPTTVKSHFCKHEFESFLAREQALGRTDLVFPIYYIRVPTLEREAEWRSDPLLSIIAKRQWADWRELRLLEVQETSVREAIAQFCAKIVETLQRPDAAPEQAQVESVRVRPQANSEQAANDATSSERDATPRRDETLQHQHDAPTSPTGIKDEPDRDEAAKEQTADVSTPPTLLDALWPETEQNREHRYLTFVALGALAFSAAVTLVDAVVFLFGPSWVMLLFQPAFVALYVRFIARTLWPEKPRGRFRRFALVWTVAAAAFAIMYVGQGTTYYFRPGYMLLATSILYLAIVAAGSLRVTLPLVLLSALAFMTVGFIRPSTFFNIVSMDTRFEMAGEILVAGAAFAGAVTMGWNSPLRMVAAAFLINLAETLWVALVYGSKHGLPLLTASVVSALGVAALTKRAWQSAAKRSPPQ
jgi:hypothetical protein